MEDEDLADDLEVEVMEQQEEHSAKTTTADDLEVKAMEHQEEDLYPMKATTTNGGDRAPAIITEMPTPKSRQATPVITWPKDKARIRINTNTNKWNQYQTSRFGFCENTR